MLKQTQKFISIVGAIFPVLLIPGVSYAANATGISIPTLQGTPDSFDSVIPKVTSTLLTFAGIISVIMIIVGGIMYTLSAGDSSKTTKAKDTILYSVIGLVITLLAGAIVTFVLKIF